jgi:hypothetical protein
VPHPGIFSGGFNKFSWEQRSEGTGIWGRYPPSQVFHSMCKWVKPVFLLGCYGCILHGTGNSTRLCQNFGISGWGVGGCTPTSPRYATDHLNKLGVDGRVLKLTLRKGEKDDFNYIGQALLQTNGERLWTPEWMLSFKKVEGFLDQMKESFSKIVSRRVTSVQFCGHFRQIPLATVSSFLPSVVGLLQSAHFIAHTVN